MHPNMTSVITVIPAGDSEKMEQFQKAMDQLQDSMIEEEKRIAEEFSISKKAASAILYLRSRSRWTQEKEDHLIRLDKNGEELPNVLAGDF